MNRSVPKVDLSLFLGSPDERNTFVRLFGEGLMEFGFVILTGHGIDRSTSKKAYDAAASFFSMSPELKKKYENRQIGRQRGYTPVGKEKAKDTPFSDLKEFWHTGSDAVPGLPENLWPEEIPEMKTATMTLFNELNKVGYRLMEALEIFLQLKPQTLTEMLAGGNTVLRSVHYMVPTEQNPEQLWAAEHEDINLMTLLIEASGDGLEIKTREGHWLPIMCSPEEIVVDTGDMFQRLTNGLLPAVTHRVVAPKNCREPRYSMPFFIHPSPTTSLSPLRSHKIDQAVRYPIMSAASYLNERLRENGVLTIDHDPLDDHLTDLDD